MAALPRHLVVCDRCRELFLLLADWHKVYQAQRPTSPAKSCCQELVLLPIHPAASTDYPPYRLAAQGEQPTEQYVVSSYSNAEQSIVGRLLQDRHSKKTVLYLIADNPQDVQAVHVELKGPDVQGLTDLQGRIDFGVQSVLNCTAMHVHSPQAVFELSQPDEAWTQTMLNQTFLIKNSRHDEMEIEINHAGSLCTYRLHFRRIMGQLPQNLLQVAAVTNMRTIVQESRQGISVIETEKPEKLLRIRIYQPWK